MLSSSPMKAILCPRYGSPDVLEFRDVPKPQPRKGEVLVKIHASSLNAADWHILRADPFLVRLMMGLTRPRIKGPGGDMAGTVEAVGSDAGRFKTGDAVMAELYKSRFGGCAEYTCVPEGDLVLKPRSMSFEEAATLPLAGGTAVKAVRDLGRVGAGSRVLVNGASGGVGIFVLQIAKALGAEVTAVCSAGKAEQARALGADHVIDYMKEDFTKGGERYDVILGVNGYHPIRRYRDSLLPGGRYVMIGGAGKQMAEAIFLGPFLGRDGKTLRYLDTKPETERLEFLAKLADAGKLKTVIDRSYPLAETAQALRYLEEGHTKGKVVIRVPG